MASLQEAVSERRHYLDTQPKRLPLAEIREAYVRANRRLLILDYDGTLIPLSKQAKQAAPPPVVIDLLTALAAGPRNCVALMSGRPAEHVDRWFGSIGGIWLVAEDGAELRPPLSSSWEPLRSPVPTDWKSTVMPASCNEAKNRSPQRKTLLRRILQCRAFMRSCRSSTSRVSARFTVEAVPSSS